MQFLRESSISIIMLLAIISNIRFVSSDIFMEKYGDTFVQNTLSSVQQLIDQLPQDHSTPKPSLLEAIQHATVVSRILIAMRDTDLLHMEPSILLLHVGRLHLCGIIPQYSIKPFLQQYTAKTSTESNEMTLRVNISLAVTFFQASADHGNSHALFLVGALRGFAHTREEYYAREHFIVTHSRNSEIDTETAGLSNFRMAHDKKSILATLAIGYRYLIGDSVPQSCGHALRYYKLAADHVATYKSIEMKFKLQMYAHDAIHILSDDFKPSLHRSHVLRIKLDYILSHGLGTKQQLDRSVVVASMILFSNWNDVNFFTKSLKEDAILVLHEAVRRLNPTGKVLLGHLYAYGLVGASPDINKAISLYNDVYRNPEVHFTSYAYDNFVSETQKLGINSKAEAANALGRLYFYGIGVAIDYEKALEYFKAAARYGHTDGLYHTAVLLSMQAPTYAAELLESSAKAGHILAVFKLARLQEKKQEEWKLSCDDIVKKYKIVAEQHDLVINWFSDAMDQFLSANYDAAWNLFNVISELGVQAAHENVAWILSRKPSLIELGAKLYTETLYKQVQRNSVAAKVALGNLHYAEGNVTQAFSYYKEVIEAVPQHTEALYNVGYMYEHYGKFDVATYYSSAQEQLEDTREKLLISDEFYELAQRSSVDLYYLFQVLRWKVYSKLIWVDIKLFICSYNVLWWWCTELNSFNKQDKTVDNSTPLVIPSDDFYYLWVPVMKFNISSIFQSQLSSRIASNDELNGLTIELWLFIPPIDSQEASGGSRRTIIQLQELFCVYLTEGLRKDLWVVQWVFIQREGGEKYMEIHFPNAPISSNIWHHVALSWDAVNQRFYLFLNGVKASGIQSRAAFKLNKDDINGRVITIGNFLPKKQHFQISILPFTGQMANIRLWSKVVTISSEINQLMQTILSQNILMDANKRDNLITTFLPQFTEQNTAESNPNQDIKLVSADGGLIYQHHITIHYDRLPLHQLQQNEF